MLQMLNSSARPALYEKWPAGVPQWVVRLASPLPPLRPARGVRPSPADSGRAYLLRLPRATGPASARLAASATNQRIRGSQASARCGPERRPSGRSGSPPASDPKTSPTVDLPLLDSCGRSVTLPSEASPPGRCRTAGATARLTARLAAPAAEASST